MAPQVQCRVLGFTCAQRSVEAPTDLSLALAALPAPPEWGVRTRRAEMLLTAFPMTGRMYSFAAPLYEPTSLKRPPTIVYHAIVKV